MNSEKEFKKILNEKLSSKQFDFDADSWEQAREMLESSREEKKRKPFFFILLSAAVLMIGGFVAFLFYPFGTQPSSIISRANTEAKPTVSENLTPSKDERHASEHGTSSTTEKQKTANYDAPEKHQTVSGNKEDNVQRAYSENKLAVSRQTSGIKNANSGVNPKVFAGVIVDPERSTVNSAATVKKQNEIQAGKTPASDLANIRSNQEEKVQNPSSSQALTSVKTETVTLNNTAVNTASAEAALTETAVPVSNAGLKDSVAVTTVTTSKVDTTSAITHAPVKPSKTHNSVVSVEGGIHYFTGWKTPDKRDARGYNPVAGVNFYTPIHKNLGIMLGAHYYWVGQLSYSNHTSKVTRYRLGEESQVTVFTPTKLHYIGFPVLLGYNLGEKHHLALGCNVAYLMNVTGKQETYLENIKGIVDKQTSTTSGYTEGFRPFDAQLLLIYRRRIMNRLYANTGLVMGLTDVKDNALFATGRKERNIGIKFTLTYNISKK